MYLKQPGNNIIRVHFVTNVECLTLILQLVLVVAVLCHDSGSEEAILPHDILYPATSDAPLDSPVSSARRTMDPGFKDFLAKPVPQRDLVRKKRAPIIFTGTALIAALSAAAATATAGAGIATAVKSGSNSNSNSNNYYDYNYGSSYGSNYGSYDYYDYNGNDYYYY